MRFAMRIGKPPTNGTASHPHVTIERRPRDPQRVTDIIDLEALVGVQLLGQNALVAIFGRPPKVKSGGWIGGHDYGHPRRTWGVKKAVDEWAANRGLAVERDRDMSWFVTVL